MSTYKRLPRGKQKPHDEFVDWTTHAILWVKARWQWMAEILGVAIVVAIVIFGASQFWQHRSEKALGLYYEAGKLERGSDVQVEKLSGIVDRYTRTPAGQEAMMLLGTIYLDKKDYEKAIAEFKKLAGKSRNRPMMNVAAVFMLAEAELKNGDPKKASETYLKASADPHNNLKPLARLRAGQCLEKAGDFEGAIQLYRQVIAEAKEEDRLVKEESEERLIWLMINQKAG